jgi:hypothetical protein
MIQWKKYNKKRENLVKYAYVVHPVDLVTVISSLSVTHWSRGCCSVGPHHPRIPTPHQKFTFVGRLSTVYPTREENYWSDQLSESRHQEDEGDWTYRLSSQQPQENKIHVLLFRDLLKVKIPKKWKRSHGRRDCSDEGGREDQESTFECVLTTPSRNLSHKHCSFKYTRDTHVNRLDQCTWNDRPNCSSVRSQKPVWLDFRVCTHTFHERTKSHVVIINHMTVTETKRVLRRKELLWTRCLCPNLPDPLVQRLQWTTLCHPLFLEIGHCVFLFLEIGYETLVVVFQTLGSVWKYVSYQRVRLTGDQTERSSSRPPTSFLDAHWR